MRVFRVLTSLLLTVLFLVSFAGMRLLVHHCSGCETSEILFASEPVSCCSVGEINGDADGHSMGELPCCADSGSKACGIHGDRACCDFDIIYLIEDYQGLQHKPTVKLDISINYTLSDISTEILTQSISSHSAVEIPFIDPPPRMVGKAFILYAHQIKIA